MEQTISNVVNQGFENIEYIVIDGASEDGTIDLLREFDDRIDFWVSEPDAGLYDAMNKGWSIASPGSAVLFLAAGDKFEQLPADCSIIKDHKIIFQDLEVSFQYHSVFC